MKKSFSFVLMGALGFSAAVGASSFGSSTTIDFNDIADAASVSGSKEDGFVFSADAERTSFTGGQDNAVLTTISPFDNVSFAPPSQPFFSIFRDDDELFQFTSVTLGGSIFDLPDGSDFAASIYAFATDGDGKEFVSELMVSGLSRTFGAGLFDLSDVDLNGLGFAPAIALKGGGTPSEGPTLTLDDFNLEVPSLFDAPEEVPQLASTLDSSNLEVPSQVPVPASVFLLGSALIGGGAFARRKKKN